MAKYAKIVIFTMFFLFTYKIYAQNFYKVTPIPKEKIKYIEESVDSENRDIQFDQSFMVCLKKDCFYVVPNQAKKDEDKDYENYVEYDYRYTCSLTIIDNKYDSKKDVDLKVENEIDREMNEKMDPKTWRRHIPSWYGHSSYDAIKNHYCAENQTVSSIAFINKKENERPIILVALSKDYKLINKDTVYKFDVIYFDGVKYRPYLNKKLEKYLENKKLTVGKSIMVVKREIEKWLKDNQK